MNSSVQRSSRLFQILGLLISVGFIIFSSIDSSANAAPITCKSLTAREWKFVAKAPDKYRGKYFQVFGRITQFDGATGDAKMRADVSGVNVFSNGNLFGGDNSILIGSSKKLAPFVQGDIFSACIKIIQSYTYRTAFANGSTTAPYAWIRSIKLVESAS